MALEKDVSPDFKDKENQHTPTTNNGFSNVDLEQDQPKRSKYGSSSKAGGRIADVLPHLKGTCSWQKTAALLFSEYICLAIMSFPYSYSVLGLVPGLILTVVIAGLVLYTSLVVWEFCLRHPEGLHVLVSAKYLNTITNHSQCTVVFAVIAAIICWFASLPRTFSALARLATVSALFTFLSVLLAAIFAGIETHPQDYNPDPNSIIPLTGLHGGEPIVTAIPVKGTTFVAGMSAFLNISYTFIGQITIPSFIAEMREPKDFPKALWAVTIAEIIVFGCVGSVVYAYTGNNYNTSPAFGSLGNEVFKKVSFSFMIPTLIFLGVLYASVSARFIFFRIFEGTKHKTSNTIVGWSAWAGILAATWVGAFIIAEVIPFFSDLLSLMSSLFDSFFGFIFWGVAYIRMRRVDGGINWIHENSWWGYMMLAFNLVIIGIGQVIFTNTQIFILTD
ncbi:related to neutral amino acid permease [Phialocephala subalpina]|uniref:Related to neutral amino acid permease n=1 Tax=Phialocephala subalpina TaxID=576137 RepID=A0A1L7XYP7_9HELO|nr:related to neutral amino acid permease [Phialocephala subalpina]